MIIKFKKRKINSKGALLLELLIVISLLAIILSIGANAIYLSIQSNKFSGERDVASALASEALEAVRATAEEDWNTIYNLTKNSQHYFPTSTLSPGKWILSPTVVPIDEQVIINDIIYTRYITVDNVSRDSSTRDIQDIYSEISDDPSTQKITVTVSWDGGNPVVFSEYFFRWKNKICNQTDWSGGVGSGVKNCPDNTYGDIVPLGTIDTSGGKLKLQ